MPPPTSKTDTYIDHEQTVAERYRWWGVYLIREKRRLQGIAEAVQAEEAAAALGGRVPPGGPPPDRPIPEGLEAAEGLLTCVDAELEAQDALAGLEAAEAETATQEPDRVEATGEPVDADRLRRKLRGRAALLGAQKHDEEEDEDF